MNKLIDIEDAYLKIRNKEERVYDDEVVANLPYGILNSHKHYKEWLIRQVSLQQLLKVLGQFNIHSLLDLGCGNGWMSNYLNKNGYEVIGVDINQYELDQAKRLFEKPGIRFVYGDIFENLPIEPVDCVVISAALQYFESPGNLFNRLFDYLSDKGVIVLMDTFLYGTEKVAEAKSRSGKYYQDMGVPEMSEYYFHHAKDILKPFMHNLVYRPGMSNRILGKFGKTYSPFPMYVIHK